MLKVDENQCELDMLHDEQVRLGENKYSTLKKVNILNFITFFKSELNYSGFKLLNFSSTIKMYVKINILN